MTKQEVMDAIVGCAEKLGHMPSIFEVMKMTQLSHRQIRTEFGSFTQRYSSAIWNAKTSGGQKVPLEPLFMDWAGVVRKVEKRRA